MDIFEMIMIYRSDQYLVVFDGMIRTLLAKMAEEGCTIVSIHDVNEEFKKYFIDHEFIEESEVLMHKDFPGEFFKPCPGCRENKQ
ncbi:hypothetical protein [Acetobacterium tundrae]|uniref:Uncharacterized protein n=1 Tax=Acetobacterium tundrae TaxID=132932 RepID=A0ABR6WHR8_9FIRM|nr:hypothetical protein [Acetobacterium tundrae]MBC3795776.1 hypothetical protein [Acetobacterium tundrae]